ncbi:histidinol-phosphatase [bacterium]|nr:histidinol-phosphatase [bacterium]MBU1884106.1 histidinol-phosphatase [bacterium]
MLVDLHNHTTLCNHAEGTVDEYVEAAIKKDIQYFGFSDHAPMNFDPAYRMSFEQMHLYEKWVNEAKIKYQDKIEVLLGYEVDYLKNYMDERVLNADVDFLIGSVHFIDGWGFDNPEFIGRYKTVDIDTIWQEYFDAVEEMAKFGKFDIIGHLDLIKVFKFMPKRDILSIASNALKAIKKSGAVLEINMAGLRKPIEQTYPSKELLSEAFALDIPITFGSDAHKPEQVGLFDENIVQLAREIGYKKCAVFKNRDRAFIEF